MICCRHEILRIQGTEPYRHYFQQTSSLTAVIICRVFTMPRKFHGPVILGLQLHEARNVIRYLVFVVRQTPRIGSSWWTSDNHGRKCINISWFPSVQVAIIDASILASRRENFNPVGSLAWRPVAISANHPFSSTEIQPGKRWPMLC